MRRCVRPRGHSPAASRPILVVLGVLVLAVLIQPAVGHQAARADDPLRLASQITDRVDALGDRAGEVATALDELRRESRLQLFVVYVRSFDGTPAQEWADATARRSDLGRDDALLAVATGDRSYAYSFDADYPLTDAQLEVVAAVAIEPPLASNDWAGAAIGAADGYAAALAGQPVPAPRIQPGDPDPGGGGGGGLAAVAVLGCLVLVLAIVGLGVWLWLRSRKGRPARVAPAGSDPLAGLSDGDLSHRADSLLVEADDAIRTSEEELGFALAQYGPEATASFTAAVASAKEEIAHAFHLRQQLDDSTPEDPQTRRGMLAEIIRRCEAADRRLDAEADAFDALRDLEGRLDQAIPEVTAQRDAVAGRLPVVQSTLVTLRETYAESALRAVADNGAQAQDRIQFASDALSRAATEVGQGDRAAAALAVRGAQEAVSQAGTLLDAVDRLSADLVRIRTAVQAALTDVDADIAAGRAAATAGTPGAGAADLAGEVARAEQVATTVRAEMAAPRPDPVAGLRRLEEVGAGLDRALANVRDAAERADRARSALDHAITGARAEISAAGDFIAMRRGAVGSEARTRLAEAQRHLERAVALAVSDPAAALAEAQRADALAEQAGRLARGDVDQWSVPGGSYGGEGGFGGIGGAVLGGILLGGVLGGGRRGGFGGGFGTGGWGGRAPGGFGGSASRARRSGGGRARRGGGGRF